MTGLTDVNALKNNWKIEVGTLVFAGNPFGVLRTGKQFENFILDVEWKFIDEGGNSDFFIWAYGTPHNDSLFPTGVEVQMPDPG